MYSYTTFLCLDNKKSPSVPLCTFKVHLLSSLFFSSPPVPSFTLSLFPLSSPLFLATFHLLLTADSNCHLLDSLFFAGLVRTRRRATAFVLFGIVRDDTEQIFVQIVKDVGWNFIDTDRQFITDGFINASKTFRRQH